METIDAVNLVVAIDCKWNTIQTLGANHASEAVWMVRLASSPKDTIQNRFFAHRALFKCILKKSVNYFINKFP